MLSIWEEGIAVDDDELDGIDIFVAELGKLFFGELVRDDARIDGGMQRAELAAQRLGIPRELMRGDGFDARLRQDLARPFGGDDLVAVLDEILAELCDALLVVNTYIRSLLAVHIVILSEKYPVYPHILRLCVGLFFSMCSSPSISWR